jgi:hydrogenase expression/formation protein HypC
MCLGVPGKVLEWVNIDPVFSSARIEFAGLTRVCSMACVPNAQVGDYVVVHAGIAISRIDEAAAKLTLDELMDLEEELDQMRLAPSQTRESRSQQ